MQAWIDGWFYDTDTATLIAHNSYWDGSSWFRSGRNSYLYKSPEGNFFLYHTTMWEGERDYIQPVDLQLAKYCYQVLPIKEMDYKTSFSTNPLP